MSHGGKKVIGVGGLVGSGKTMACKIFEELGVYYISADVLGWEVLEEKKEELRDRFGEMVVKDDRVDRHMLGEVVFSDISHLKWLNKLTHPRLIAKILQHIKRTSAQVVVLDAALLFEWPEVLKSVGYPILVTADYSTRKKRAVAKGMNDRRFLRINECQRDMSDSQTRARYIISNNSTIEALKEKCCKIYKEIRDDS